MVKRPKQNKKNSASEKEYKKLSKKVEDEIKKGNKNDDFNLTKETEISSKSKSKTKGRRTSKESRKMPSNKSVKDMSREELIRSATSTAQHSNKTLREYEKADKDHLYVHGKLLAIAEKYDIKTRGNRVSRSFKKLSDNQLRDFITEAKQTYTGKSVKAVSSEFDRRRAITEGMILDRVEGVDSDKLKALSDEQFNELYAELKNNAASKDGTKLSSDEVILKYLSKFNIMNENEVEEVVFEFQKKQREAEKWLNRNNVKNRDLGRKKR
jgi:hypothetical protein